MTVNVTTSSPYLCKEGEIRFVTDAAGFIADELGLTDKSVSVFITDDATITSLNSTYRNINKATNVLSFPLLSDSHADLSQIEMIELGDIVVSIETARRESHVLQQSLAKRLFWLLAHGMLHLLGHDHETSEHDAAIMLDKEKQLLTSYRQFRSRAMTRLAINVDHTATIRQARGGVEPDPVTAAAICELAGAGGIVIHLREDRRHIQDRDVYLLKKTVKTQLNLEMGANKEIINIALDVVPDMITLVPEKREELTTEGGLDVLSQKKKIAKVVKQFNKAGIPVSIFADPDSNQIKACSDIGATFVEIHTGRYCDATSETQQDAEFNMIVDAAEEAYNLGLKVNAGHGLDYNNTSRIAALETIDELSIGHAVISRAVFTGLEKAVKDMIEIIRAAQPQFL